MILDLVDRRTGPDGTSGEFHGTAWDRLGRLVDGLGGAAWLVDVVLVDDELSAGLNRTYRNRAGVTDVLSFGYLEQTGAGAPDLAAGTRGAAVDLWLPTDPQAGAVGELVLAPGFIAGRCAGNGWPLAEEIPLLVVHGCLHLLGWDHADPDQAGAMQDLEQERLAAEGLPHPLRQRS